MLRRLAIENYGLIADATVVFADGATMFTGETGSGKTMVLGALAFALGGRSNADAVRRGATRALVTLEFEPDATMRERFAADGFGLENDEDATLAREMTSGGKSVLRLNGRATSASVVREMAPRIAEIVGQHEAQRLLLPAAHQQLLDRSGGDELAAQKFVVESAFGRFERATALLQGADADGRRALERVAYARFGVEEIEAVAPQSGEDEILTARRRYLDNVERIAAGLRAAHESLANDENSAVAALGAASSALRGIADVDESTNALAESAAALQSETAELATSLARALDAAEFDPAEVERVNARLDALDRIKRKYGGSLDAALAQALEFRETVDAFDLRDERRAEWEAEAAAAHAELAAASKVLSKMRTAAARRLEKHIAVEFADLSLATATLQVAFEPVDPPNREGGERVEFLFAANANEKPQPLSRVASGGELSRLLLAIIVSVTQSRDDGALIFDEIDAGIGGATATAVGARLGKLAARGQILCVTHLAQIASWADRHYVLEKIETKKSTEITIREIQTIPERTSELARMLSGETHTAALTHAKTLLQATQSKRTNKTP